MSMQIIYSLDQLLFPLFWFVQIVGQAVDQAGMS